MLRVSLGAPICAIAAFILIRYNAARQLPMRSIP